MTEEPPPSLKLLTIDPASPDSLAAVRRILAERVDEGEVQTLFSHGLIVNTKMEPSALRDLVARALGPDQQALVVEFERWSARGSGVESGDRSVPLGLEWNPFWRCEARRWQGLTSFRPGRVAPANRAA